MPDDLAAISQQAAQQIVPQAYTGPYQRDQHELILRQTDRAAKIIQAAIEAALAALAAHRQQVAALHQDSLITDDELNKIEYDLSFDRVSFDLLDLVGQMRRERQQVAALAAELRREADELEPRPSEELAKVFLRVTRRGMRNAKRDAADRLESLRANQ
jgi:hypothetical protein